VRSWICLALPTVLLLGCGGGSGVDTSGVHGTVTMDGQPLANAYLEFIQSGTRPAYGKTDSSGNYTLEYTASQTGAVPGEYKVKINTGDEANLGLDGEMVPAVKETVPSKYNSETTLTFTVVDGESNVANFELDSAGTIEQPDVGEDEN